MEISLRDMKEQTKSLKFSFESIETNLPKMIRELIDFYFEKRV